MARANISVMLVDQEDLVRDGTKGWLESSEFITVKASVGSYDDAFEFLKNDKVDLCITDIVFADRSGFDLLKDLGKKYPDVKTLVLSSKKDSEVIFDSFTNGAHGFVPKKTEPQELITAISWISSGRWYLSPQVTEHFIQLARQIISVVGRQHLNSNGISVGLDEKERELLKHVSEGLTFVEISEKLNVNVRSVERIKSKIEEKIGTKNLADLIRAAIRFGLIDP